MALYQVGYIGSAFSGEKDDLKSELDTGHPIVGWLGFRGDAGRFDAFDDGGARYQVIS